jgi:hypothetical protein
LILCRTEPVPPTAAGEARIGKLDREKSSIPNPFIRQIKIRAPKN